MQQEYVLVTGQDAQQLGARVNAKLKEGGGWVLYGSPVVTIGTDTSGDWPQCLIVFAQALERVIL